MRQFIGSASMSDCLLPALRTFEACQQGPMLALWCRMVVWRVLVKLSEVGHPDVRMFGCAEAKP